MLFRVPSIEFYFPFSELCIGQRKAFSKTTMNDFLLKQWDGNHLFSGLCCFPLYFLLLYTVTLYDN